MNFSIMDYRRLDTDTLYQLIQLRIATFIVEQKSIYQDLDNKDLSASHAFLKHNHTIVAYARIIEVDPSTLQFGRFLTAAACRRQGYGKIFIAHLMHHFKSKHQGKNLFIEAQSYLKHFYENYGFKVIGDPYELDGIPHLSMLQTI